MSTEFTNPGISKVDSCCQRWDPRNATSLLSFSCLCYIMRIVLDELQGGLTFNLGNSQKSLL